MPKIGIIDDYLDEWHADHFIPWIHEQSKGEWRVVDVFGRSEPKIPGKRSNAQFCKEHGLTLHSMIEPVIHASDALMILAPNQPQLHPELASMALKSGKPLYIDKTFADTPSDAEWMFDRAKRYRTPLFTSSALRYATTFRLSPEEKEFLEGIVCYGPGDPHNYLIHLLEPLISMLEVSVMRIMAWGVKPSPTFFLEMENRIPITILQNPASTFSMHVITSGQQCLKEAGDDYFQSFIRTLLQYFDAALKGETEPPVPWSQTRMVMRARSAALKANESPGAWVYVEK